MVKIEDLKEVILLSHLTDPMLEKVAEITMVSEYNRGDYIFREGDFARHLYAIRDGKVGLELEKVGGAPILMDTLGRGRTFGFSALVDSEQKKYTTHAKALTPCALFTWQGPDLERLFYEDYELGFLFMRRIAKIAKSRLQVRNIQFLDIYR